MPFSGGQAKASLYLNSAFPGSLVVKQTIDFSVSQDNSITIPLPTGITRYAIQAVRLSGASASINGATASVWTAAGGTGTAVVANNTAVTLAVMAENTVANQQQLTGASAATTFTASPLFFRVQTTASGTAVATIVYQPAS